MLGWRILTASAIYSAATHPVLARVCLPTKTILTIAKLRSAALIRASKFVTENIKDDDFVALKMNCEGSEVLILRDLMRSGAICSIDTAYIDFDIRKIPSQQAEEQKLIADIHACGFHNYVLSHELCMVKTYSFSKRCMVARRVYTNGFSSTRLWLALVSAGERGRGVYRLTLADKIMHIVPKAIWGRLFRVLSRIRKWRRKLINRANLSEYQ